jgi:hypothetical protein
LQLLGVVVLISMAMYTHFFVKAEDHKIPHKGMRRKLPFLFKPQWWKIHLQNYRAHL